MYQNSPTSINMDVRKLNMDEVKRPPVIKHQNGRMYVHKRGKESWRSITPTAF